VRVFTSAPISSSLPLSISGFFFLHQEDCPLFGVFAVVVAQAVEVALVVAQVVAVVDYLRIIPLLSELYFFISESFKVFPFICANSKLFKMKLTSVQYSVFFQLGHGQVSRETF
jgi:hypothetical protein